jgi:protein O-mannosyl-transferase
MAKKKQPNNASIRSRTPLPVRNTNSKKATSTKLMVNDKRNLNLIGLGIIMLLGLIIYSNTFKCSFHYDDLLRISNNSSIRNLWDLKGMWKSYPMRPVGIFSFALNYQFGKLNVWGYHLVNIIIHLINALLVWWLTTLIFSSPVIRQKKIAAYRALIALAVALLFVSHPLATQSVTYIVQRMASMMAIFYLISLALYMKARMADSNYRFRYLLYAGCILSALLAMLTKENAFTLPFAILMVELFFIRTKKIVINFKDYRLYLAAAGLIAIALIVFYKASGSILVSIPPQPGRAYTVTSSNYLFTQFSVILKYIQLLFIPANQMVDYDFPISNSFFEIRTLISFLILLGLFVLGIFLFKRNRLISFGIFWFFLTLMIESSIIPINDVIFEHRTYLPSFGFFLILSSLIFIFLWDRYKFLAVIIFVVIVGSNSYLTYERNKVWKDDLSLWTDNVNKAPNLARPYYNLGNIYGLQQQYDKAITALSRAIALDSTYTDVDAYFNRGTAYSIQGQWNDAIADFTKLLKTDPKNIQAYGYRGLAYKNISQWDNAISDFTTAIKIDPKQKENYFNRAIIYRKLNEWDKAIADYSKVIELDPSFKDAYNSRAIAYINTNKPDMAIADFTSILKLDPQNKEIYFNRALTYNDLGQNDKAIADYNKALEIDPNYSVARANRDAMASDLKDSRARNK